jgi:hypothetical protein
MVGSSWYSSIRDTPYVPGWIEDAARKLKEEEEKRQQILQRKQQVEKETVLARGRELFELFLSTVEQDVETFNEHFPENERRLQKLERVDDSAFTVRRRYTPSYTLSVKFDALVPSIIYEIDRPNMVDGQIYSQPGGFGFRLQTDGTVSLVNGTDSISVEEASREVLLPALEGFVSW